MSTGIKSLRPRHAAELPAIPEFAAAFPFQLPGSVGQGFAESLEFGDRFTVGIERFRLAEHSETLVHGEDMIKFHVRLSGRRLLTFDRRDIMALDDAATCVLLHELDVPKMDHILADHEEASITVAMPRSRLLEYLDVTDSNVPLVIDTMLKRYSRGPRLASGVPSREEVRLAREIIGCNRVGPLRRMFLEAKTLELICTVLDHLSAPADERGAPVRLTGNDRRRLQQVRELIEATFMETVRIEDLARQFGLNRNKLCTGFRLLFGVSIFDFVSGLKMDEAQRLLRQSQLSVSQIALAIGYSSAGAFSAAFHRRFGHSPTDVRRR
jgi:AraC-like DNA-binding protein